jgi:glycogen phosphorylase
VDVADSVETRTRVIVEDDRTGMHPTTLERAVLDHLHYTCSKDLKSATLLDVYLAVAHASRDRLVQRWIRTQRSYYRQDVKRAYYLSAEFLLGRFLGDNLRKLGLWDFAERGLSTWGLRLEEVLEQEVDPGLGNGGLGRLAACFLDSMATLELPGYGYGIRYEFGIFEQRIQDGWQIEVPDAWSRFGNPWEIARHEYTVPVKLYGRVEHADEDGRHVARWVGTQTVLGVPYDMPIAGYGNNTVNTLRLWSARASSELDLAVFNAGDYRKAVEEKALTESISKVLYPNDHSAQGKELRLKQQYFFVACSIADILRRYDKGHTSLRELADKVAIQLNDTHPAIAVAELMRVLVDERRLEWDAAWELTRRSTAYTNHTLLSEALERWPVALFQRLLPRHLEIIYEINRRLLEAVEVRFPGDGERARRMSIIEEGGDKQVRMGNLAVAGSHRVNGVAALHTRLVREQLFSDFAELWPEQLENKTNGVTPRRFILLSNPALAALFTERLGERWVRDLDELAKLHALADDRDFRAELSAIKRANKQRLAALVEQRTGVSLDPDALFDTQIKRIHEYKRQLLAVLGIIALYWELKDGGDRVPRAFLFAGKAAPGYVMAKLVIKLIHDVAKVVNADPDMRGRLRVAFIPNYSVSLAERIVPGTDLSEQISMAGKEASGTGNMKFAMNGALTIGTLDGANVEIREEVGAENFFLFGLTAEQVVALDRAGYVPRAYIDKSPRLARALQSLASGHFSPDDPGRFRPIVGELENRDTYKHCADFDAYFATQAEVDRVFVDRDEWGRRVIRNLAGTGKFSSDRTIREYAKSIWGIRPLPIRLDDGWD